MSIENESEEDGTRSMIGLFLAVGIILTFYGVGYGSEQPGAYSVAIAGSVLMGSAGIISIIKQLKEEIIEKL